MFNNIAINKNPQLYSPLTLAYVGDAVYELYVRTRLSATDNQPASKLHRLSTHYVKAKAQNDSIKAIMPLLSEQEVGIYKRGRNAKSATVPKNADLTEYRCATGFEALVGYLYLKGESDRLSEVMELAFGAIEVTTP